MIEIDDKLNDKFRQQMDGRHDENEELEFRLIAKSYAMFENSIAVLSNLRVGSSFIYFGRVSDILGFEPSGCYQKVDSVWEEEILCRIHIDDQQRRNLQELAYYHLVSTSHSDDAFAWHLENTMRMSDKNGKYHPVIHRIFYFKGDGQRGISYALCLYNLTSKVNKMATLKNTLTGEERCLNVEDKQRITDREKMILAKVCEGLPSKVIGELLKISKHTVDRHRQNIISKLQVMNMTEACHKAKQLGFIE